MALSTAEITHCMGILEELLDAPGTAEAMQAFAREHCGQSRMLQLGTGR